ncbi:LOW QUALITY PROTEIN: hypothetical protein HID58_054818, partial [Brassica napus]
MVTNPRTRALALARSVWIIAGFPMFVTPWSSEFSPEESQLTSAVVPVELRGVKENFEVAKLWVHVNLLTELPKRIEVDISVSYPRLPVKCGGCGRFGHEFMGCSLTIPDRNRQPRHTRRSRKNQEHQEDPGLEEHHRKIEKLLHWRRMKLFSRPIRTRMHERFLRRISTPKRLQERACCASSVTVTHTDQITEHSAAEQAELNSSPFFLVYNRKSGRK